MSPQTNTLCSPDFGLTRENSRDVASICARLEGLPLAIELAAARIKFFTPHALLTRLDSWLKTLTGGARSLPPRQQTLRNAIEWSYDLLSEEEKRLFRRVAVFLGGCTVEAVEAVCNPDGSLAIDVLEGLISLVDKSLLRQGEGIGGEPRFTMLEMIHEYGRDKLLESGEQDVVKRRHAQYFAEMAEATELIIWGPKEDRELDRLQEEHHNMRAALQWGHGAAGDIDIGLRLVVALGRFWEFRGYLSEGRERLAAALSKPESKEERVKLLRAWALTHTN
jgi:predicted ATPase